MQSKRLILSRSQSEALRLSQALTACGIAEKLGMPGAENCLTGDQLAQMSEQDLQQSVEETQVYARISPEQKLKIVKALQNAG